MRKTWPLLLLLPAFLFYVLHQGPAPVTSPRLSDPPVAAAEEAVAEAPGVPAADPSSPAEAGPEAPEEPRKTEPYKPRTMLWILRQQNADGTWGENPVAFDGQHRIGKVGMTSLALLALLSDGYSHLNKDEFDGLMPGKAVKSALIWLTSQQREDGSFPSDSDPAIEQALAGLVICEAYGMTSTQFLKEPAQHAIEALHRLEAASGGWGDAATNRWGAIAYLSGQLGELIPENDDYAAPLRASLGRAFGRNPDLDTALAYRALERKLPPGTFDTTRALLLAAPPTAASADGATFHRDAVLASMLFKRHDDAAFKGWAKGVTDTLALWRQPDGSFPAPTKEAALLRTCFAELTHATLYCYCWP